MEIAFYSIIRFIRAECYVSNTLISASRFGKNYINLIILRDTCKNSVTICLKIQRMEIVSELINIYNK